MTRLPAIAQAFALALLFAGCGDDPSRSSARGVPAVGSQPANLAEGVVGSSSSAGLHAPAQDKTQASPATPAEPLEPADSTSPPAGPSAPDETPPSLDDVLASQATPTELVCMTKDETAAAGVRVTALRRLEALDAGSALEQARALLEDEGADALLKSNAVAVLARSADPRADELIAGLDPRYQALTARLRQRARR